MQERVRSHFSNFEEAEDEDASLCNLIPTVEDEDYKSSNAPVDVNKTGTDLIVKSVEVQADLRISDFINVDVTEATFTIVFRLIAIYFLLIHSCSLNN